MKINLSTKPKIIRYYITKAYWHIINSKLEARNGLTIFKSHPIILFNSYYDAVRYIENHRVEIKASIDYSEFIRCNSLKINEIEITLNNIKILY